MLKIVGHGSWMEKNQHHLSIQSDAHPPGFIAPFRCKLHGNFNFSLHLTFSCKSSLKIFDTNNYAILHFIHLLDDLLIISLPGAIPAAHILTVQKVFSKLGIPIAQEKNKNMGPATSIEFLGMSFDSVKFSAQGKK